MSPDTNIFPGAADAPGHVELDVGVDAALAASLRTIDYPATREDLLRIAAEDRLPQADVDSLRTLPEHSYEGTFHVLRAIEAAHRNRSVGGSP